MPSSSSAQCLLHATIFPSAGIVHQRSAGLRLLRTPIARRCVGYWLPTVVRPLKAVRSATDADDNRTALCTPPTARFTDLGMSGSRPTFIQQRTQVGHHAMSVLCQKRSFRLSRLRQRTRVHSGNPALRRPSISSFEFDCPPRAVHSEIVNARSTSSRRAAASRASASRPRWAKADARQR